MRKLESGGKPGVGGALTKHGVSPSAMEWPYSSFRRYVEANIYPADWGQGAMKFDGVGHE